MEALLQHVCAEIQYEKAGMIVHSDICPDMAEDGTFSRNNRKLLHQCLDEWLDNSIGTGYFYIGDVRQAIEED
jgi:hypothetical protein